MTSRDLHVVWGVNRWVLVETPNESVEQQVASKKDFAALLTLVGLAPAEAKAAAREQWRHRPGDARPYRSSFGALLVIAVVLFLVLFLGFLFYVIGLIFWPPAIGGH